jgi:hypothetical protein
MPKNKAAVQVWSPKALTGVAVDPFGYAICRREELEAAAMRQMQRSDHERRLEGAVRYACSAASTGLRALVIAAVGNSLAELLENGDMEEWSSGGGGAKLLARSKEAECHASPTLTAHPRPTRRQTAYTLCQSRKHASLLGREAPGSGSVGSGINRGAIPSGVPCRHDPLLAVSSAAPTPRSLTPAANDTATGSLPDLASEPLVFLHGVGLGLLPYLPFVWRLAAAFPTRPLMVLEVRHVALRLCGQARSVDEVVRAVVAMLHRHGKQTAHFAAHSYGTFVVRPVPRPRPCSRAPKFRLSF